MLPNSMLRVVEIFMTVDPKSTKWAVAVVVCTVAAIVLLRFI